MGLRDKIALGVAGVLVATATGNYLLTRNYTAEPPKTGRETEKIESHVPYSSLDEKLKALEVFDAGGLTVPKGFDVTREAFEERVTIWEKLGPILDEEYGKRLVVVKFSTPQCVSCIKTYREYADFANQNPDVRAVHVTVGCGITDKITAKKLRSAGVSTNPVPSYYIFGLNDTPREASEELCTLHTVKGVIQERKEKGLSPWGK